MTIYIKIDPLSKRNPLNLNKREKITDIIIYYYCCCKDSLAEQGVTSTIMGISLHVAWMLILTSVVFCA